MLVSPFDPPLLFGSGVVAGLAYRHWLCRRNEDWFLLLGIVAVAGAWLHLTASGVAGHSPVGVVPILRPGSIVLEMCYALAYPFWFWLGGQLVFLLFGRTPEQGGLLWLYRIEDRTDSFDSWDP